jgi:SAM-dependent methyltransferase
VRKKLETYFQDILASELGSEPSKRERLVWRLSCFDAGLRYVEYIQENHFPLEAKQVLDVACAWGGHAAAFAARGARVLAADYLDHRFDALARFALQNHLDLWVLRADCQALPVDKETIDVLLALELVEHLDAVEPFAQEVARVLRPGGLCILSTPPRLRSFYEGEAHYKIRGLPILPLPCQRWVATKVFRRTYPYPITRQYTTARGVIRPFENCGLSGSAVLRGPLARRLQANPRILSAARQFLWNFLVFRKPG